MASYATYEEYVTDTGDSATAQDRAEAVLSQQSAKLRAVAGISDGYPLTDDQKELARLLVTDAAAKKLVPPALDGFGGSIEGASQASFTANGFTQSVTVSNPSGSAYFDRNTLSAFLKSLGRRQRVGIMAPSYGVRR